MQAHRAVQWLGRAARPGSACRETSWQRGSGGRTQRAKVFGQGRLRGTRALRSAAALSPRAPTTLHCTAMVAAAAATNALLLHAWGGGAGRQVARPPSHAPSAAATAAAGRRGCQQSPQTRGPWRGGSDAHTRGGPQLGVQKRGRGVASGTGQRSAVHARPHTGVRHPPTPPHTHTRDGAPVLHHRLERVLQPLAHIVLLEKVNHAKV